MKTRPRIPLFSPVNIALFVLGGLLGFLVPRLFPGVPWPLLVVLLLTLAVTVAMLAATFRPNPEP